MAVECAAAEQQVVVQESTAAKMEQTISSQITVSTEAHMAFEQSVQVSRQEVTSATMKSQNKDVGAVIDSAALPPTTIPTEQMVGISIQHREEMFKEEITVSRPEQREHPLTVINRPKAPEIDLDASLRKGLAVRAGCPIRLFAVIRGRPSPKVTWKRLGVDNVVRRGHVDQVDTMSFLVIPESTREDSGKYSLTLSNSAGEKAVFVRVKVHSWSCRWPGRN
uniref:Ig-like domain-containing protein n=1 Tax=Stegastes partitus TaxID=144197 RepID=A0A3B5BMG6_9TELE